MSVRIPLFSCSGSWGVLSSNSGCSAHNNICAYTQYGDGSGTSGFFVFDVLQFER
uniref:Xylanase inhibitor N-terminal domain-containing protein n=1 Tax=Brassica oleracea var. oleracea TaxID=109376 RepID=A0A0D3CR84_BRAOL